MTKIYEQDILLLSIQKLLLNLRALIMKINTILMASVMGLSLFSTQSFAENGLTGNVALTSDYVRRGISQTDETAAIQGGVDFTHESGLHTGAWGSSIDLNNNQAGSMELEVYGGFQNEVNGFTYDIGAIYFAYPGSDSDLNYDFFEVYLSGSFDFDVANVSASVNYSPEYTGDTGDSMYYAAGIEVPLAHEFKAIGHVGHLSVDNSADYTDWSLGVARNWLEMDWSLAYTDTDLDTSDLDEARTVLTVGKSF